MAGRFDRELRSGGELLVWDDLWYIQYRFLTEGEEKEKFYFVDSGNLDVFVEALKYSWDKCLELVDKIPMDESYTLIVSQLHQKCLEDLRIFVVINPDFKGIQLFGQNISITEKSELDALFQEYTYARRKAGELQELLSTL